MEVLYRELAYISNCIWTEIEYEKGWLIKVSLILNANEEIAERITLSY